MNTAHTTPKHTRQNTPQDTPQNGSVSHGADPAKLSGINRLRLSGLPRMWDWGCVALVLMVLVAFLAPHQLPVSLYKLSLVALAAVVGYWVDRSLFPYARPDLFLGLDASDALEEDGPDGVWLETSSMADDVLLRTMGVCMIRRAIIVAAAMLAVGLGA
jgi:Putative 2/3 transmembrane domain holin